MEKRYITNPMYGGKITCHKCRGFIEEGDEYMWQSDDTILPYQVWFHKNCFNPYEHYYGLDKPVD